METNTSKVEKVNTNEYLYKDIRLSRVFSIDEIFPGMNIFLMLNDTLTLHLYRNRLYEETDQMYDEYLAYFLSYFIKGGNCYVPIMDTITIKDNNIVERNDNLNFNN